MPAKSTSQQGAAGMALAAKRGEISPDDLRGAAKQMYASMTTKQLEEFAGTAAKRLPRHATKAPVKKRGVVRS